MEFIHKPSNGDRIPVPINRGWVLAHEAGHFMNLWHREAGAAGDGLIEPREVKDGQVVNAFNIMDTLFGVVSQGSDPRIDFDLAQAYIVHNLDSDPG